ncbi:Uncharacterised protein [Mycobacteroides abscessus subsp. abscessus]|nr:Uncharacterised protein [Mycobacteroides abscessus subsp. abscessus]
MFSSIDPCPVKVSPNPIVPGTISASTGALRELVTDSDFGRYPARESANSWRE